MAIFFSPVYDFAGCFINMIIFSIHFMFAEILYLYWTESSKTGMQGYFGKANTFYLEALDQFPAKMQACCWCGYRPFVFSIYRLITFLIFLVGFALDIFWK